MNIGAIGTSNYYSGYHGNRAVQKAGTKSFENTVANNTTNIVIHGFMGEKTETGDTVVGAWGNAIAGTSATVYKPQNFDEDNPVYYMKIWDKDGNVTERTVNLNEIDPQNCNSFDMYAYCCYANDSGKCSSAMANFMGSHAFYQGEQGGGSDCRTWESRTLAFPCAVNGVIHDAIACYAHFHDAKPFSLRPYKSSPSIS